MSKHKYIVNKTVISAFVILTLVTGLMFASFQNNTVFGSPNASEKKVVDLVNKYRASKGLKKLSYSNKLEKATNVRVSEIVNKFSHTRPNGQSGAKYYLKHMGSSYAGENLAKGFDKAQDVYNAWLKSDSHKKIIKSKKPTKIAVSKKKVNGTTYWVLGTSN